MSKFPAVSEIKTMDATCVAEAGYARLCRIDVIFISAALVPYLNREKSSMTKMIADEVDKILEYYQLSVGDEPRLVLKARGKELDCFR